MTAWQPLNIDQPDKILYDNSQQHHYQIPKQEAIILVTLQSWNS